VYRVHRRLLLVMNSANVESVYRGMESRGGDRIGHPVLGHSVTKESEPHGAGRIGPSFTIGHSVMPSRPINFGPYGPFIPNNQYNAFDTRYRPGHRQQCV